MILKKKWGWHLYMSVNEQFVRQLSAIGEEGIERLAASRVIVFGVGGVGGFAVEALCRAGVGQIDIVDGDRISVSNINRQLIALHSTVGRSKVEVMRERMLDINPNVIVNTFDMFYLPENADSIDLSLYDHVIDAVDTVSAKLEVIERASRANVCIISAMGAGNKLDPTRFEVTDIYKTSVCPLARTMRRELKARGIKKLRVVYSKEEPCACIGIDPKTNKPIPSSMSFVPSVMGLILAGEVIKQICGLQ